MKISIKYNTSMINTFKVLIIGHGNPVLMNCNCNLLFNDLNTDIFLLSKESSGCVVWVGPKLVYTYTTIIIEYSMMYLMLEIKRLHVCHYYLKKTIIKKKLTKLYQSKAIVGFLCSNEMHVRKCSFSKDVQFCRCTFTNMFIAGIL